MNIEAKIQEYNIELEKANSDCKKYLFLHNEAIAKATYLQGGIDSLRSLLEEQNVDTATPDSL